ncbi:2-dehydro-3-deoxygalactonokinase [Sphingomonas sp. AR_OL41]|uniref:2-dehydro-3-deoxygalactonokinase n=1 Tax=Sphingomonas sp. AR_OL41 TaxID=3042729 RepID=UPI00247FF77A|nr:2-dehydro-3-deoxygalactonokinase [Sphingomonas sp. AR_OL41]MDH7973906.1 2-dehydro-3-deoxygalactonokinase [Sphingomonas sp. AR_OL41]
MSTDTFIAAEWGTMRIRMRLLTSAGEIVEQQVEDVRLADLDRAGKIARLRAMRTRWPDAAETLWLAGMIGSPLGLETVPQAPCPIAPAAIAGHARRAACEELQIMILPGLSCTSRFGDHDVLRGEEVAAAGLIDPERPEKALLLSVPGMHGKWIELGATIERFHSSMTVEIHHVLSEHSILAPLMQAAPRDGDPFRDGLHRAVAGGGVARLLFTARTAVLAGRYDEEAAASYLWGVMIGADIGENLAAATGEERRCYVAGTSEIAALYRTALNAVGMRAELVDGDRISALGFARLRHAHERKDAR